MAYLRHFLKDGLFKPINTYVAKLVNALDLGSSYYVGSTPSVGTNALVV